MEDKIKILDKNFVILYKEEFIKSRCRELSQQVASTIQGTEIPTFISILEGAMPFTQTFLSFFQNDYNVRFIEFKLKKHHPGDIGAVICDRLNFEDVPGPLFILEDIMDTGQTMYELMRRINQTWLTVPKVISLLQKPKCTISADYIGFTCPNDFIVGFGMDYKQKGRELENIYVEVD